MSLERKIVLVRAKAVLMRVETVLVRVEIVLVRVKMAEVLTSEYFDAEDRIQSVILGEPRCQRLLPFSSTLSLANMFLHFPWLMHFTLFSSSSILHLQQIGHRGVIALGIQPHG